MRLGESEWPTTPTKKSNTNNELRPCFLAHHEIRPTLVDASRFSSWKRLNNVVGLVYRFVTNCRLKASKQPTISGPLTMRELQQSESLLFRQAQYGEYSDEIVLLSKNRDQAQTNPLPKSSRLHKLSPWMDNDGVLRM